MAGSLDVALEQHSIVREGFHSFTFAGVQHLLKIAFVFNDPHPLATTPEHRLDHQRVPNIFSFSLQGFDILVSPVIPRHDRNLCINHNLFGFALRTHGFDSRSRWPQELNTRRFTQVSEACVLRQKPVARVNSLSSGLNANVQNPVPQEITFSRRCRTESVCFVCHLNVHCICICVAVHGNSFDPQLLGSTHYTNSNLPSISNQNLVKSRRQRTISPEST
mmetsp:Transcript_50674/g.99256  ORF Transcript_50674/g.99256 Transcript_50674/m.99256 type:complete len:220 (-) Transcript_50674:66-725(-)